MALATRERTIDGISLTTQQLPVLRATALSVKIVRQLGPFVSAAKQVDLQSVAHALDGNAAEIAPMIGEAMARLDEREFLEIARLLLAETVAVTDGQKYKLDKDSSIDAAFAGRLDAFLKALAFSVEVNFQSFFDGVRGAIEKLRALAEEDKPSASTSPS